MKKFLLLSSLIFISSIIQGQNSASITQTGNGHSSINLQLGTNNTITVVQSAETNSTPTGYISEISQNGSENTADVEQGGPNQDYAQNSKGGARVEVSQTGTQHSAVVDQNGSVGGLARVTQIGVNQIAEVWNANNKGEAVVYQDAPLRNEAYLYQNRSSSNGFIKQTVGGGNLALVNQYKADNSEVIQAGSNNVGYVKQNQPYSSYAGTSTGNIYQYGSGNGTGTFIPGEMKGEKGGGQTAYIENATVFIKQSGADYISGNLANIFQGGDGNGKIVDVFGNAAGIDQDLANNSTANITQFSDFNTANVTQIGDGNFATVLQKTGDYNVVNLTQDGGADARIVQDGDHNTLMGLGTDPMATSLDGSILQLEQTGSGNTLQLQQSICASAIVTQAGNSNIATVIQY